MAVSTSCRGLLAPGDLVVVNTSGTLPAAVPAVARRRAELELRLSTPVAGQDPERCWIVELRRGDAPFGAVEVGEHLVLPGGATGPDPRARTPASRLWLARLELRGAAGDLPRPSTGSPIRYGYVPRRWPLSAYQNVYAVEPGSAEMPSAGRPFTTELITRLVAGGVLVAPIVLHTGVSSQERHERPYPERFRVPEHTARLVNAAHEWGGRVIATGPPLSARSRPLPVPDGSRRGRRRLDEPVVTPARSSGRSTA